MKRGTRETLPYRLTAALLWGVGMLLFAFVLAYGHGAWRYVSGVGIALALAGFGVIAYAVRRFGPDA